MNRYVKIMIIFFAVQAHESDCFHLTNMTAPPVQDPRSSMHLHCRFDMGGEELYAVKWYKDDHEFFRYTPAGVAEVVTFPVPGVDVDLGESRCNRNSCDLLLINIKRPQSSGAYRCEVSSEAPSFKLASETHNVSVAALPEEPPMIDGLKNVYTLGDYLVATCTSGLGDPKPQLKFYINKLPVSNALIRNLSTEPEFEDLESGIQLRRAKIQIRMLLDRKPSGANINAASELSCISTIDLDHNVAPSVTATRTFTLIDHNQVVNNQKFRWADPTSRSGSSKLSQALIAMICFLTTFNYYAHLQ